MNKTLSVVVVAAFLTACQAAAPSPATTERSSAPTATGTQSPSSAASPSPTSSTASLSPTASAQPSLSGAPLHYVAFGDSWPYGAHCGGCDPFPVLYADGLATATSRKIDFTNLTTNGGTAESLLQTIKTNDAVREAVKGADIVMIATGGNAFEPAFDATAAGTCGGPDQLDCFRTIVRTMHSSFDRILTEIETLRAGKPTTVRLVGASNEYLADPGLIELLGPDFGTTHGVTVTRMLTAMLCEVAAAHNARCVDIGPALNGPDLLDPQDVNTQEAMQAVADAILATGVEELPLR